MQFMHIWIAVKTYVEKQVYVQSRIEFLFLDIVDPMNQPAMLTNWIQR